MDRIKQLTSDHPWSSLSTITTFDLGDENEISDDTTINNKNNDSDVAKQLIRSIKIIGLLNKKTSTPISLLVQSLVQQLCSLLESDPIKSAKLYNVICEKLYEMKLIDESYSMEEFEMMRSQYQRALYQLVGVAKDSFQPPVPQNRHGSEWSRYYREFIEIEFLGGGGFGRVFKAKHRLDGSEYAVKKICIRSGTVKSVMSHLDEVKTFASLNHPNIVQYKAAWLEPLITKTNQTALNEYSSISSSFSQSQLITHSSDFNYYAKSNSLSIEFADSTKQTISKKSVSTTSVDKQICCINENEDVVDSIDCTQGVSEWATLYIQMALCQVTLRKWLDIRNQTEKEYPPTSLIQTEARTLMIKDILGQLAQGLEYMHSKGIVHHDIKPTNIFISNEIGHISVQLGDFGLACPLQKAHSEVPFGTHLYAAPEQLNGKCDTKNDIYSLGIVLLELIESFTTDMEKIQNISELRKGRLCARISAEYPQLAHIMNQLVAKNPSDRPTATQLLSMLISKPLDMYDVKSMQKEIKEKDAEIERLRALLQNAGISEC